MTREGRYRADDGRLYQCDEMALDRLNREMMRKDSDMTQSVNDMLTTARRDIKERDAEIRRLRAMLEVSCITLPRKKQGEVLMAIHRLFNAHGVHPTFQTLGDEVNLSKTTIHEHVQGLADNGFLCKMNAKERHVVYGITPRGQRAISVMKLHASSLPQTSQSGTQTQPPA